MVKELSKKVRLRKALGFGLSNLGFLLTGFFLGVGWINSELNIIGYGLSILAIPIGIIIKEW